MSERISVDFHAHILPDADHGASNAEESLFLLRAARKADVQTVIATPHFYPHEHDVESFLARRKQAYDTLREACGNEDLPRVGLGAEVLLCPALDRMDGLERLCVEGTDLLLLELPFSVSEQTDSLFDTLEVLIEERSFSVVLAHPNRYPSEAVERGLALGCRLQLNAEDMGRLSQRARIERWLRGGAVFAVGSDVHHDDVSYLAFGKAAKRLGRYLMAVNEETEQLLNGFFG